jgi:glycosyltransferase involved in cell wall biosynthesis
MKSTICLNMIVKNEASVIKRCLATIKPWIDTWVISDTGSTDGTQDIIREFMKDIPGELIETPWVDFAHNRNVALDRARDKADYSLFMDADGQFIPTEGFYGFDLTKECYSIHVTEPTLFKSCSTAYFLLRNSSPIAWTGVLHEYLSGPNGPNIDSDNFLGGTMLSIKQDGNRSKVLEEALLKEPQNSRYMFYLGQSYSNAFRDDLALVAFEKRTTLDSTDTGENFFARFMVGVFQEKLGFSQDVCLESFMKAHNYRPSRQEPVYKIAQIYVSRGDYEKAHDLLKDYVFSYNLEDQYLIQANIRDYLLPILYSETCFRLKKYEECHSVLKKICNANVLSEDLEKIARQDIAYLENQIPYLS